MDAVVSRVTGQGSEELILIISVKIQLLLLKRGILQDLLLSGGPLLVKDMPVLLFIMEEFMFLIIMKERKLML